MAETEHGEDEKDEDHGSETDAGTHGEGTLAFVWTEHLGLIAGALLTLVIAIRFLAIASWDVVTAAAVLTAIGPADAIVGTIIGTFFMAVTYVLGGFLGVALYRRVVWRRSLRPVYAYWIPGALCCLVFLPLLYFGLAAFIAITGLVFAWFDRNQPENDAAQATNRRFLVSQAYVFIVFIVLLNDVPWLPRENVTPEDDDPVVGYVLREDADRSAVLVTDIDGEVAVVEYFNGQLEREICDTAGWTDLSVIEVLTGDDSEQYSECDY